MTDKHTPGPWKVITLDGHTYINPDRDSGEYALIARIQQNGNQANARLIAAAPELLKALENLTRRAGQFPCTLGLGSPEVVKAYAAIKAAKGDA